VSMVFLVPADISAWDWYPSSPRTQPGGMGWCSAVYGLHADMIPPWSGNPSKPHIALLIHITYLYNSDPGGAAGFGIRAGLSIGNHCYWSMLTLVLLKNYLKSKKYLLTCSRFLFNPYLVSL
jgi:hypothetical protein